MGLLLLLPPLTGCSSLGGLGGRSAGDDDDDDDDDDDVSSGFMVEEGRRKGEGSGRSTDTLFSLYILHNQECKLMLCTLAPTLWTENSPRSWLIVEFLSRSPKTALALRKENIISHI